jgi:membrane fusion protein, multidrug efflux system
MRRQGSFFGFYLFGAVLVAVGAGTVYYFWHAKQSELATQLKERAAVAEAGPTVAVATSKQGPAVRKLTLLGEALPYKTATLYAKVSGYLTKIAVDKGDRVKAGQFIAEITSPELDHQYDSAVADLENKRRLAKRTRELADQHFYSEQAAEDAETNVRLAEQQVAGIKALTSYKVLTAPFTGIVTARYADPGALVTNATSNQSSALPVVTVSDPSRLRVTVYVDQSEAPNVHVATPAEVVDASNSGRQGTGKVARVAGELDTRTRTQLTEVDFDNSKGEFIPGSFVNVNLLIPSKSYVEVPAPALVMRDGKRMVAVVGPDSRIKLTPINVASTDGKVIRVESGLEENVRVALNLPNTLVDGAKVTPAGAQGQAATASTAAASAVPAASGKSVAGGPVTPAPK